MPKAAEPINTVSARYHAAQDALDRVPEELPDEIVASMSEKAVGFLADLAAMRANDWTEHAHKLFAVQRDLKSGGSTSASALLQSCFDDATRLIVRQTGVPM